MAQTAGAAAVADPISNAVVSPEASLVARVFLKMVLANSAGAQQAWVAMLKALLANVLMNDVLNWWNGAGPDEIDEAERAANEAIRLDPNSPLAHHAQGLVQSGRGRHNDARKAFRAAKRIDGGFARGHAQFGNQKSFLDRLDEVQDPLDKAISLIDSYHPVRGYFHWGKGRGFFEEKKWDQAIYWLKRSVEALPTVWYNRCYLAAAQNSSSDSTENAAAPQTIQAFIQDPRFDQATFNRIKQLKPDTSVAPSAVAAARNSVLSFVQPLL